MDRKEHLLTCLTEECAEVAKRVSKAQRFGLGEVQPGQGLSNAVRIGEELNDLLAVASILVHEGIIPPWIDPDHTARKLEKIERFMTVSREQGVLA